MSDDECEHRLDMTRLVGGIAAKLGCPSVAVHAGTVPADPTSASYAKLRDRTRRAAEALAESDLRLLLETGRESAEDLRAFIEAVGVETVGVNFDPGNFVVYGADDPVRAVTTLKGLIDVVHVKDARASSSPGVAFGSPATLGSGDANIPRVLSKLRIAGFDGPLLVEENTRAFGMEAIPAAADYLRSMLD
jgi:sugar phosphate isomerase/epimerase